MKRYAQSMRRLWVTAFASLLLALMLMPAAQAFDLAQLRTQLSQNPQVQGQFTQQRYLQGLSAPLVSQGHFALSFGHGMIWRLQSPVAQVFRITANGIDQQLPNGGWASTTQASMHGESKLFLAFLEGDLPALQDQFNLALTGTAQAWQVHMTPRSALLQKIFRDITLAGGARLTQIQIVEAQGDHSVLSFHDMSDTALDAADQQALQATTPQ